MTSTTSTPMLFLHPNALLVILALTCLTLLFTALIYLYCNIHRIRQRRQLNEAIAEKRLAYAAKTGSSTPKTPARSVISLGKLPPIESRIVCETKAADGSLSPVPSNYRTFDFAKRYQRHLSSDSSYTSSNPRRSQPISFAFDTVKSKFQRRSTPSPTQFRPLEAINSDQHPVTLSSDSDGNDDCQSLPPSTFPSSLEYSLADLFRVELIYKIFYSIVDHQLSFQLLRLHSMQPLIDRCFPSLMCKIRLYTNNDKRKSKKYFSKKDPTDEIFTFDLDQYALERSSLSIHLFGQQKNEKRLELGHVSLVLNEYEHLVLRSDHQRAGLASSEQFCKSIPIDEERIDLITQHQVSSEDEARALICLVYENDRCLLHVGVIKITGLSSLIKSTIHHRGTKTIFSDGQRSPLFLDLIQVKIFTMIDGKLIAKKKSLGMAIEKNIFTFNSSFHFDYLSLHKTSISIQFVHRRASLRSQAKLLSTINFGSTQLKNQQSFQHWTDTLAAPNRPHIQWHRLPSDEIGKEK